MSRAFLEKLMEQSIIAGKTAYCPHCRAVTNLEASITWRFVSGPNGGEEMVVLQEYHCEICHLFVHGDESPLTPQRPLNCKNRDDLLKYSQCDMQ